MAESSVTGDRAQMLKRRLLATFQVEARDHLHTIDAELDVLQGEPSAADAGVRVEALFRAMHTLKGASRSVGLTHIEGACHQCEALLRDLSRGQRAAGADELRLLRDQVDAIAASIGSTLRQEREADAATAPADAPAPPPSSVAPAAPPQAPRAADTTLAPARPEPGAAAGMNAVASASIRVELERLGRLSVIAEELLAAKLTGAERARLAKQISAEVSQLRARSRNAGRTGRAAIGAHELEESLRGIESRLQLLERALGGDHRALRGSVDELFEEMRHVRMMRAETMLESFPAMVRDLCRTTGKAISLAISGAELTIDRNILDAVKDPLIHLLRNAVDHGIEMPDARIAAGKPASGRIAVDIAPTDRGRIVIQLSDDGAGFPVTELREAVVRARAGTHEQIRTLSDDAVCELAFRAGVSSSPMVTSISGQGMGLAIVRERIERIDGSIELRSEAARGAVIRIEVPASIATHRGLLVGAGDTRVLLPGESVDRAIAVSAEEAGRAAAQGLLVFEQQALPFGRLSNILGLPAAAVRDREREQARLQAVVIRNGEQRAVCLVDEILGETEVLIKDFRPPLTRVRNVLSAGLLGSGELVLVLRSSDLIASIHAAEPALTREAVAVARPRRLLVVDDSITTRTMERDLFEAAGYLVQVAADGVEAWRVLQTEDVDIVVSDVDMPGMNGFELTGRIRADKRLAQLPVVLVTALEAREDKEQGVRVGANAYVVKSGFDQSNLLDIVWRLSS